MAAAYTLALLETQLVLMQHGIIMTTSFIPGQIVTRARNILACMPEPETTYFARAWVFKEDDSLSDREERARPLSAAVATTAAL